MAIPSVYINLEDDISKIALRLKKVTAEQVVLVCPKRCLLFSDSINLRLLKKQTDILGKQVFILTMDEHGQAYAKEAGFGLKFLPKGSARSGLSDIHIQGQERGRSEQQNEIEQPEAPQEAVGSGAVEHRLVRRVGPKTSTSHRAVQSGLPKPKVKVSESIFPKDIDRAYTEQKRSRAWRKLATAFVALCLLVILAVVFVILPKAFVTVSPKAEPITRDMTVSAAAASTAVDAQKLAIPAVKVDETAEVGDKFESQGKKQVGNRASGMVQIYNFTRSPLNLKASTTTFNIGSKNYYLLSDDLSIKPTTYKNAFTKEVDPSSLSAPVEIAAAEGGDSYNVPAEARMEITNLVFGSKPLFLYAKTSTAVTGGTTRFLSVVSPQDVSAAQTALGDAATKQIGEKMSARGLVLLEKAYSVQPISFNTDNPAGTQTPAFTAQLKVRVTGLAIKFEDLKKLIFDRMAQTLPASTTLVIKNDNQISYQVQSVDLAGGSAVLTVHFEGSAVARINLGDISHDLAGKTKSQASDILKSRADIDQINISLNPPWQSTFPLFASKIQVTVQ